MWIFKNNAFVSIVQDRDMDDQLWVRGRIRGDVERFMGEGYPGLEVIETNDADYRFRACVAREDVAVRAMEAVSSIDYHNFKGSIAENDRVEDERHNTYLRVWTSLMSFQRWFKAHEEKEVKEVRTTPRGSFVDDWWQDDGEEE